MYSTAVIAALAGLTGLAVASPAPLDVDVAKRAGSFRVEQIETGKVFKAGPIAMEKAFLKFSKTVPANIAAAAAAAAAQGSAPAVPEQFDSEYLVPVTVGSQTLNLDFDTGSSDLWVFSNELPAREATGHTEYTTSSSKLKSGESWKITYADGSGAAGNVYADKVVVGAVTATSQAVEAATSVSSSFTSDTDTDGILGLAFSTINTVTPTQQTTFFDTVKSTLTTPLFAADLKFHATGSYDFGFIDTTKFTGTIDYAAVTTRQGFWEFTATGYAIAGSSKTLSIDGIADTGTTLLYLPASVVSAYYAQVSGAQNSASEGGFIFPCSATLPSFSLAIGGKLHTVPGEYINYAPLTTGSTTCFGGIQSDAGIGFAIFGDIFLKSQYVVFDESQASPRIGFGQQS